MTISQEQGIDLDKTPMSSKIYGIGQQLKKQHLPTLLFLVKRNLNQEFKNREELSLHNNGLVMK